MKWTTENAIIQWLFGVMLVCVFSVMMVVLCLWSDSRKASATTAKTQECAIALYDGMEIVSCFEKTGRITLYACPFPMVSTHEDRTVIECGEEFGWRAQAVSAAIQKGAIR